MIILLLMLTFFHIFAINSVLLNRIVRSQVKIDRYLLKGEEVGRGQGRYGSKIKFWFRIF